MLRRAVLSAVVLGVGWGYRSLDHFTNYDTTPTADHPDEWDPRVVELVDFVESARELAFKHPVYVEFLAEADYVALFDDGGEAPSTDDEQAAAWQAGIADAAGLTSSLDPLADEATVSQVATLGFYDSVVDRVIVRGDRLTPDVKVVLVHELTHVLQDQWFDRQVGGADDFEVRAIHEADAMRIEDAFLETLSDTDSSQAIVDLSADESTEAALADVPWALVDQRQAPYILGPSFLRTISDEGGNTAVDAVFIDIPTSEELIDPTKYGVGSDDPAVEVTAPIGAALIDTPHAWSMYDALTMLDAWLPWREARTPLDGWAGAGYVAYEQDGVGGPVCFSAKVRFDTSEQAIAYSAAITAWSAASTSATTPVVDGLVVDFEACERAGSAADPPRPTLMTSETIYLEQLLMERLAGSGEGAAWNACVARAMLDDPTVSALAWEDDLTVEQNASIDQATEVARWICSTPPPV
jgi:hypothetical protein